MRGDMNWVCGEQIAITNQSFTFLFPLYLSLGLVGGGEVK